MGIGEFFLNLYSNDAKKRIQSKLNKFGSKYSYDYKFFILNRLYVSSILFILFLIFFKSFIAGVISFIITHYLLEVALELTINERKKQLENDAIFYFEILSLTVTSGKTLKKSIELTTRKMKDNLLSQEFESMLENVEKGKNFSDALNGMKKYIPSEDVNSVITSIKECYELGSPLLETINGVIDLLNNKRLYDAKSKINTIPIKVSIWSCCVIIPIIVLLILGPIIISIM